MFYSHMDIRQTLNRSFWTVLIHLTRKVQIENSDTEMNGSSDVEKWSMSTSSFDQRFVFDLY